MLLLVKSISFSVESVVLMSGLERPVSPKIYMKITDGKIRCSDLLALLHLNIHLQVIK
jgi:hypothetical protein